MIESTDPLRCKTFVWNIFWYAKYVTEYKENNFWLCAVWYL